MKTIEEIIRSGLKDWKAFSPPAYEAVARAAIAACAEEVRAAGCVCCETADNGLLYTRRGFRPQIGYHLPGDGALTPERHDPRCPIALAAGLEKAAAAEPEPDPEDRPATRQEISRALQRTHAAFQRGPIGSPEDFKALAERDEAGADGPACESCGKQADGRSLDDVPLCAECGRALEAGQ